MSKETRFKVTWVMRVFRLSSEARVVPEDKGVQCVLGDKGVQGILGDECSGF